MLIQLQHAVPNILLNARGPAVQVVGELKCLIHLRVATRSATRLAVSAIDAKDGLAARSVQMMQQPCQLKVDWRLYGDLWLRGSFHDSFDLHVAGVFGEHDKRVEVVALEDDKLPAALQCPVILRHLGYSVVL